MKADRPGSGELKQKVKKLTSKFIMMMDITIRNTQNMRYPRTSK